MYRSSTIDAPNGDEMHGDEIRDKSDFVDRKSRSTIGAVDLEKHPKNTEYSDDNTDVEFRDCGGGWCGGGDTEMVRKGAIEARDRGGAGADDGEDDDAIGGGIGVDGAPLMSECIAKQR